MLTSSDYNYEFGNAIRNKRRNEKILSEGYDKGSDSYMFPSGSFNDFSDSVVKENLFRRLGTVLHGNYLWRQSDDTILSRPVVISPYMPDIADSSIPVAFGDLSYFWIL